MRKLTIEEMQKIALSKGGICLSEEYVNRVSKLLWQCKEGHQWQASAKHVKFGSWCPKCRNTGLLFLRNAQAYAEQHGGKCLSTKWVHNSEKLEWKCKEGHRWQAKYGYLKTNNRWCRECNGKVKTYTIEDLQKFAASKGGKCLSEVYVRGRDKLIWECSQGHIWEARSEHILHNRSWCPTCSRKKKHSLVLANEIAQSKNGQCLSTSYKNSNAPLLWRCEKGHEWESSLSYIKNGNRWCPKCAGINHYTIEDMRAWAKQKGGLCLSREYVNSSTPLQWQCKEGHKWRVAPNNILLQKSWCRRCAGLERKTLKDMQQIAAKRGGACLSTEYKNVGTKLTWQCADGHIWEAKPNTITSQNSWCPQCRGNYTEEKCRFIIEQLTQYSFPPKFFAFSKLKTSNSNTSFLHLDGYCEELNLAFEYNGRQHYKEIPFFHRRPNDFVNQQARDALKVKLCKKNGIKLLVIPYTQRVNLEQFIMQQLLQLGFDLKVSISSISYEDFKPALQKMSALRAIAKSKGGELLSKEYTNVNENLKWRCSKGHTFLKSASEVRHAGRWCNKCSSKRTYTISDMKEIAAERGGKCHSEKYINGKTKLNWECAQRHRFSKNPAEVIIGQWCPTCADKTPITIEELQEVALQNNGKCLSKQYVNNSHKLEWECKKGHRWLGAPKSIRKGHWCKICSYEKNGLQKRGTIEKLQKLALEKEGKCLSTVYEYCHTKYQWECKKGHQWQATASAIKSGSWCRKCNVQKTS